MKAELTYRQIIRNFNLYEYGGIELTGIYLEIYEYITGYFYNIKKYKLKGVQHLNDVILLGANEEELVIEYHNGTAWLDEDVCDIFKHYEYVYDIFIVFKEFGINYLNKNHDLNIKHFNTRGESSLMEDVKMTMLRSENKNSYIKEI